MPQPRIQRTVSRSVREPREGMSRRHLDMMALCFCCVCGAEPTWPDNLIVCGHHLLHVNGGKAGGKWADRWTLPLCNKCHDAAHAAGDDEAWLAAHGVDGRAASGALWAARNNQPRMIEVSFNVHQRAVLRMAS